MGGMRKKIREDRTYSSEDMTVDRQTHRHTQTDRHAHHNTPLPYQERSNNTQEAQLSPSDRAMHLVSSNLANYHATVQKLLIRQVLTKSMV